MEKLLLIWVLLLHSASSGDLIPLPAHVCSTSTATEFGLCRDGECIELNGDECCFSYDRRFDNYSQLPDTTPRSVCVSICTSIIIDNRYGCIHNNSNNNIIIIKLRDNVIQCGNIVIKQEFNTVLMLSSTIQFLYH